MKKIVPLSNSLPKGERIATVKICKKCSENFEITNSDLEFYKKISPKFSGKIFEIPAPTLCPECRQQRRLAFRNERNLYRRKCDATGENIISVYSPDKKYKVYEQNFWWSDKWNPLDYGKDFDSSKSFFEQFWDLLKEVPKAWIINKNSINSEYTNICANNKDSYLLIESSDNESCFYSYWIQNSKNCIDCSFSSKCENCYNIDNCFNCYKLFNSKDCNQCNFSDYLQNCINCEFCFDCQNLDWKKYFIKNIEYSKKDYFEEIKKINSEKIILNNKSNQIKNSPKCSWNYILNSNNCEKCFHTQDSSDCKNSNHIWRNAKNIFDCDTVWMNSELIYESINVAIDSFKNLFCNRCWTVNNSFYSDNCDNSSNLFWCVWLKNKKYCILNKQYSKQEYEKLVPKIIEKMWTDEEWWEFFPANLSPFWYNETVAKEYFPLSKEEILEQNFNYSEYESPSPKVEKIISASKLPENILDIPDDILNWAIECETSKKPFRIIKPELEFYRKHNLEIPKKHPDVRHFERMKFRKI